MRTIIDWIKIIGVKHYSSLFKYYLQSQDKHVVMMRTDLINVMHRTMNTDLRTQVDNLNYKIDLLMDYYLDPADARSAVGRRKEFQDEIFEILLMFRNIVEKHNIPYWVDYGTLLGAVRHSGIIPWDDDIDVSVLEDEIPRLKKILDAELPEDYEFAPFWLDRVYRVRKKNGASDAFLDVYSYMIYGRDEEGNYKIRMKNGGDHPKTKTVRGHRPFPSSILFPLSRVTFNGYEFNAPHDPDAYLRLKYGNYHTLPKKRHTEAGHADIYDELVFYPDDFTE